jgi:hypothetical protein
MINQRKTDSGNRSFKLGPPEFKAEVLTTQSQLSVRRTIWYTQNSLNCHILTLQFKTNFIYGINNKQICKKHYQYYE